MKGISMTLGRRIAAIASSAVLVGTLAACSPPSSENTAEAVTLTVSTWTHTNEIGEWWDAEIAEFEKENPNVTIDIQQIAFADYVSTITTQGMAGAGPDIIHVPTPTSTLPAWAEAGFLAPLDDYLETTDVAKQWPEAQGAMAWDGTSYGALLVDYGYTLFYNKALLDQAGVDVPTSPEELIAAAKAVTELPGDAFGFAITDDNTVNFVRDALVFATGHEAEWVKDGKWNFGSPEVVSAFDTWRELGRKYSPIGTNFAAKRESFLTGNSAMMIEGPFYFATVQSTVAPALKDSLKIAKAPFKVNPGDVSHGLALADGLDDPTRAASEAFLSHLISKDSLTRYSTLVTSPTAREGSAESLTGNPLTAPIVEAHEGSKLIVDPNNQGIRSNYAKFSEIVAAQLHILLQGDAPAADILSELDRKLDAAGLNP